MCELYNELAVNKNFDIASQQGLFAEVTLGDCYRN